MRFSISLKDLMPYTICEQDTNIFFKSGLEITLVFDGFSKFVAPFNWSVQQAAVGAANSYNAAVFNPVEGTFHATATCTLNNLLIELAVPRMDEQRVLKETPYFFPYVFQ